MSSKQAEVKKLLVIALGIYLKAFNWEVCLEFL